MINRGGPIISRLFLRPIYVYIGKINKASILENHSSIEIYYKLYNPYLAEPDEKSIKRRI